MKIKNLTAIFAFATPALTASTRLSRKAQLLLPRPVVGRREISPDRVC
jgi:hypothetical protein